MKRPSVRAELARAVPHGPIFMKKTPSRLLFPYSQAILFSVFFEKTGEMAERSKAAVSKTVNGIFPFGGSNPPLSASSVFPGLLHAFPRKTFRNLSVSMSCRPSVP